MKNRYSSILRYQSFDSQYESVQKFAVVLKIIHKTQGKTPRKKQNRDADLKKKKKP